MTTFRFSTPLAVRYADLDAQGHVNNATYFTYMEQGRFEYMVAVGLWQPGQDFLSVGTIVAEATCTYKRPILLGQTVDVAVRTTRLGTKSALMEYRLTVQGEEVASGRSVQVSYDYPANRSVPIPDEWRRKIALFEGDGLDQ